MFFSCCTRHSNPRIIFPVFPSLLFFALHCVLVFFSFSTPITCPAAVQEERQRNREREGEVESTSVVNEEMPVEKILEAEMAVEQKTELHADGSSGGSSVSNQDACLLRMFKN